MNELTKKNKYITFITYGIILTAAIDYSVNFHPIAYIISLIIISLAVGYYFYVREKKKKKISILRSKYLVIIIPIIIVSLFTYKIYIASINSNNILGNDVWRFTELIIDDSRIDIDESEYCASVKFYKYRISSLKKESGIIHCKYIVGAKDRIKFAAYGLNFFDFEFPACKDPISAHNIDILSKYRYELQDNKLIIRQKNLSIIFKK